MDTAAESKVREVGYHIGPPLDSLLKENMVSFAMTRFHLRDDLPGKSAGIAKFFDSQGGQGGVGWGETNLTRGGQIEKNHWFIINKIGFKVMQRISAASTKQGDKLWYQRVLQTLFAYGLLRFNVGVAPVGEFRLSQLLPTIQCVGQAGVTTEKVDAISNTSPITCAGVFDLDKRPITLSESANFGVDVKWDISNRVWNGTKNDYDVLDPKKEEDAELLAIPENTLVEVQLIGVEIRAAS
jgi:hypothetical protein